MSDTAGRAITAETLAAWVGAEVIGDRLRTITDGATLDQAGSLDLVYVAVAGSLPKFVACPAPVALVATACRDELDREAEKTYLVVDEPQRTFLLILARLRSARPRPAIGVSPAAYVSETAIIGDGSNVYPTAHVDDDVVIGANCDILPGAYVGPGCVLGDDVTVHPHAVLYGDVIVGNRVTIHATAVLGADGFGYRTEEGRHVRLPHFGHVLIEDDVEIGAGTTIDRGMIGPTVVGEGSKIDNLVMIAHNCRLGRHNILVGQVGFAGSSTTGDYVVCAGQVGVKDHVHIGTGSTIGSKAGVSCDVPAGETWIGQPARPVKPALQAVMALQKLPEIRKQVRKLEARLAALEEPTDEAAHAA